MSFESVKCMWMAIKNWGKTRKQHRHEFLDYRNSELAYFGDKRNLPDGKVPFFWGTLRKCAGCNKYRFRVPGLREVDVVRIDIPGCREVEIE